MTRRIICLLLAMVLFSGLLPQPIAKAQSLEENPVNQFCYHDPDMEALFCSDAHIIYWNLVNAIETDTAFATSLEIASWVIGESVSEERCTEVLANLLVMQQGNIASQIESQGEYDSLKGWKDYIEDAVSIASDYLGATGKLATVAPAAETLSDGVELIEGNITQAKYYKAIVADYCYSKEVLQAVIDHSKIKALRSAAAVISQGRDELFIKQLDCLTNELGNIAGFEGAFFQKQLFFPLMKETNCYRESAYYKRFVDQGEAFVSSLLQTQASFMLAFQITMLAGDLCFGTTNTYKRYQEMRILSDIAASLSKELCQMNIPQSSTDVKTVQAVAKKSSLYKMLLTTHIRGEYLVYQLLTQDAGLLSQYRRRVDYSKSPEKTTEGVYNNQIQIIQKYYDMIESILLQLQIPVPSSTYTDLIPDVFYELPETFTSITSSASTTWNISIKPDGSFISTVRIPNWGDNTPDYPLGTSKITETHGQFTNFEKASEYSYKMIAAQVENIGPFGKTYISDDVRYIVTDTAYIKAGDAYDLYLPGTPYSELPQGLIDSVNNNGRHSMDEITPNTFILYHAIPGSKGYDAVYIGNRNSSPEISDQPEAPMSNQLDMASSFGFTKSWDIHDRSGTDHYVTSLAFHNDGTFSCCAGWYLSELFAAITGTYELNGDTLFLHYTFDGKQTDVAYRVDWENRLFHQLSEENLLIPHQIGSEYPFEESTEYSAEDRERHVRLFIQGGGRPLGD